MRSRSAQGPLRAEAPQPAAATAATTQSTNAAPSKRLKTLSISGSSQQQTATETVVQPKQEVGNNPFQITDLRMAWREYADHLPQEWRAMAERMKGIEPQPKDAVTAEVVVENKLVLDQFHRLEPYINTYLQARLNNGQATIQYRIREADERHRAFSEKEKLAAMLEKSAPLKALCEKLSLSLA